MSLKVEEKKVYGIIGPNGSGKTTLVNTITGIIKSNEGRILFDGQEITNKQPHTISRLGIGRTFQIPRIFPDLSVSQNITAILRSREDNVDQFLNSLDLLALRDIPARSLGYGQRRQLEIARAIALNPRLLFLDEPFAGLDSSTIQNISSYLRGINSEMGKTLVIVEHHLEELMELADYIFVMHYGEKIEEGSPTVIRGSAAVHDAYFGK